MAQSRFVQLPFCEVGKNELRIIISSPSSYALESVSIALRMEAAHFYT